MAKFKWILVLALCIILTGCKEKANLKSVSEDTLVQVTWKSKRYVKAIEIYIPEKDGYFDLIVTGDLYNKVEVGSWLELGDLKEKVDLDD